jgi:pyruvate kinase
VYPKIYPVNIINTTCKPAKTIPPTKQYNHNKCTQKKEREKLADSISELATDLPGKLLIYFRSSGQNGEIVAVNAQHHPTVQSKCAVTVYRYRF